MMMNNNNNQKQQQHHYTPIPLEIEGSSSSDDFNTKYNNDEIRREETSYDDDETYYSDDENDDSHQQYDNNDDEYDSDESTGSSCWKDVIVWSAWKQHVVAIMIAIVATIGAFILQQQHYSSSQEEYASSYYSNNNNNLSPVFSSTFRHEHLMNYQRTANISFCGSGQLKSHVKDQQLEIMDFHLSLESIDSFLVHYIADAIEDDDYSQTLLSRSNNVQPQHQQIPPSSITLENYHCLRQLQTQATTTTNNKDYIKGMTYFYQPPSYLDMYPEVAKEYAAATIGDGANKQDNEAEENGLITGLPLGNKKGNNVPKPATLSFTGFAAKFINLSPYPVLLYWDGKGGHANSAKLVGEIPPFDALGTATTPGQSFSVSHVYDSSTALDRWVVTADDAIVIYEDTKNTQKNKWTETDYTLYQLQKANLEFATHYLIASHRHWLGHFPRAFPVHTMQRADFVGQIHTVQLNDGDKNNNKNNGDNTNTKSSSANTTLEMTVVSVTPRVLSMDNFLSVEECHALIQMAQAQGMKSSTLYAGGMAQQQRDVSTRSSTNTWLGRDTNAITDRIYRRAARVLNMKETLLQQPPYYMDDSEEDAPHHDYTQHSIAESLQVVRYQPGEEYTAHHDFVYPSIRHRYQPTRYATLLLYLNDDFTGGETNFPRATNPTNHDGITITPRQGKAVLFYNMLPDGNVDDLSQHRSMPVIEGEKWLANLWIWDPVIN